MVEGLFTLWYFNSYLTSAVHKCLYVHPSDVFRQRCNCSLILAHFSLEAFGSDSTRSVELRPQTLPFLLLPSALPARTVFAEKLGRHLHWNITPEHGLLFAVTNLHVRQAQRKLLQGLEVH